MGICMASCDDGYEDWAEPQANTPEEAIVVPGLTTTVSAASDLNVTEESTVPLFVIGEATLPEGMTINSAEITITPTDVEGAQPIVQKIEVADGTGVISTEELQAVIEQIYGKRPVERSLTIDVVLLGQTSAGTVRIDGGQIVYTSTPKAPYISQNYYIVGDPSSWDLTCTTMPFTHSGKDVYEDPIFTVIFPVVDKDYWFAIADDKTIADGTDWSLLLGCVEGNGNNGTEGKIARRTELSDDGSFKVTVAGDATMIKMTIDMMEGTYKIEKLNDTDYFVVGDMQGWNAASPAGMTCALYPQSLTTFSYTTQFNGNANFKLWKATEFGNWDIAYGATTDGDNSVSGSLVNSGAGAIVCPEKGAYYTITCDFSTGTYEWTKLDNQSPTTYNLIGLIGGFNEWKDDAAMTQVSPNNWYLKGLEITEATELKFRANGGWDINWGANVNIADVRYGTGAQNGDNIKVPAGTYDVYMNDITGHFLFRAK